MTDDTPRDPLAALTHTPAWERAYLSSDWYAFADVILNTFPRLTLDATRPSGDEALRAAAESVVNVWDDTWLGCSEMTAPVEALRAALATPSSAPDVEGHHFDAACEECRLRARGYVDPALRDSRS